MTNTNTNAPFEPNSKPKATHVSISGPDKAQHPKDGKEFNTYSVTIFGNTLDPLKKYICYSFDKAARVAADIARDRGISLIDNTLSVS